MGIVVWREAIAYANLDRTDQHSVLVRVKWDLNPFTYVTTHTLFIVALHYTFIAGLARWICGLTWTKQARDCPQSAFAAGSTSTTSRHTRQTAFLCSSSVVAATLKR